MSEEKVALIVGAGATLADALTRPLKKQPPLDRGFFANAYRTHGPELRPVSDYMERHYGMRLRAEATDSLERVMAVLYADVFGGQLETEAFAALRTLIRVFLRRLAATTNDIAITGRCLLCRVILGFLADEVSPENMTIVTFNQDIQVEKALDAIQRRARYKRRVIFSFPDCYNLPAGVRLTSPQGRGLSVFPTSGSQGQGIALLKLHGSLNWYSAHNSPNPTRGSFFDPNREIGITTRKSIDIRMTLDKRRFGRKRFTFPVVVPPVVHKSGILHRDLHPIWALAEERLRAADRIIIFGYSCPSNDWESANLICRSLKDNERLKEISVIDPDPKVLLRYVELANLDKTGYYRSAVTYLGSE